MSPVSAVTSSRLLPLAGLFACYIVGIIVFFRPVQLRIWNSAGAVDVLAMAALILPFIILARPRVARLRPTRLAWGVCAVMALDFLGFAMAEFGPRESGHPSLTSLVSYGLALAKTVLVPMALVLLAVAGARGERLVVVATGVLCVLGETLYGTYPTAWWGGA